MARELAREEVRSLAARIVGVAILLMGGAFTLGGLTLVVAGSFVGGLVLAVFGLFVLFGGLMFSLVPFRLDELRAQGLALRERTREKR